MTDSRTPISFGSIGRALGTRRSIRELPELAGQPQNLQTLQETGIESYLESDEPASALAIRAGASSLAQSGLAGDAIDAVVYATTTFRDPDLYGIEFRRVQHALGLTRAYPVGLFGSECANNVVAVQVAQGLLMTGFENVLVITTDTAPRNARVMFALVSVFSDGAASMLLSRSVPQQYNLRGCYLHTTPEMWDVDPVQHLMAFLKGSAAGFAATGAGLAKSTGIPLSRFKKFFNNNYNLGVQRTIKTTLELTDDQVYYENIPRNGHIYAADAPSNLRDASEKGLVSEGDLCVVLSSGHNTWGGLALQRTGARFVAEPSQQLAGKPGAP
jgi:3-oxoacyl-[acyl-carrier-protein] synthase III